MHLVAPPGSTAVLASPSTAGGPRAVVEDALAALQAGDAAVLALVVETAGSTYVAPGAMALFGGAARQTGWLSGGCLEPEIEAQARHAAERGTIGWLELDTREDAALFSGAALGCRGQLRIALLPVRELDGWPALARAWLDGEGEMRWRVGAAGAVRCEVGESPASWVFGGAPSPWPDGDPGEWHVEQPCPPAVLVLGAGPEAPVLLPLLRRLGFMTTAVELRPRWRATAAMADVALALSPSTGVAQLRARHFDAALVMHHGFELDLEALEALASGTIPFVGLLGPVRRREDLMRLLSAPQRAALAPRLHSPIGLKLGGHGPEAIALSIAAQLQSHVHSG